MSVGLLLGTFKYWVLLIAAILQKSTLYLDDVINFTLDSFWSLNFVNKTKCCLGLLKIHIVYIFITSKKNLSIIKQQNNNKHFQMLLKL